ncbi:MAG: metal ABC transporter substrate-binding protein [Gammaproteobacteria bacterium]
MAGRPSSERSAIGRASPLWVALVVFVFGCSEPTDQATVSAEDAPAGPVVVYAVNYPLAYFAQAIGGDAVETHMPAPRGIDPAAWSPDVDTIADFQRADLILLNGAGYAAWVSRATLPPSRIVDTSAAFADRYLRVDQAVTHTHGPEGEHEHGDVAFTTWLDPALASLQAAAIRDALIRLRSDREAEFMAAYDRLAADLAGFDDGYSASFAMLGGQPMIFSHPVYQYLTRRYGLNARSMHWEPDVPPSTADIEALQTLLRSHPAKIMIWESDPLPETGQRLDAAGMKSIVFDPCANRPVQGDYLSCMRRNLAGLERLL